jgi:peptidoglycan hydrolase CwlO-like protein
MKKINIGVPIITLILGILIGLLSYFLFDFSANDLLASKSVDDPASIKKELAEKEASHQAKITELENKNQLLQKDLNTIKEQLASIKSQTKKRETTIKQILEPKGMAAKDLLAKVAHSIPVDSSLSPCDSLSNEVSQYLEENTLKDSLYETQMSKLDSTIAIKDSIIQLKNKFHIDLSNTISKLLNDQEALLRENKALRKEFKRQKRKSKLVTIGLMILSATAANYLLK